MINKWYENLVSSNKDGLIPLLELFDSEEKFIEHFFKSTLFFKPEYVKEQSEKLIELIKKGEEKIPVRYSMKTFELFHYNNKSDKILKETSKKTFKNKKEALKFTSDDKQEYFHTKTKVKVVFDKDGNYAVRNEINKYYEYRVSQGSISDIQNYVISHIWGETHNPYFFTSLWNITLIPNHLSFILDKPDENSAIVRKIKKIAKAICFSLYEPNKLLGEEIISEEELNKFKEALAIVEIYKKSGVINFLEKNHIKS